MTVGVPTFCGGRLAEARRARGLFKKSLGDMIGVSGTAITRYEDGDDNPQLSNLSALAERLNFPLEFFARPVWPETLSPIFWRSQTAESKLAREMTAQRAVWACEIFYFLEQEVNFPAFNLPQMDLPTDFRLITPEIIERTARELREYWGLRNRPIPDVTLALENAGIPVIHLDIPSDKQDGFCFSSKEIGRSFVGINVAQISAARARYDACHELGHAVLHRSVAAEDIRETALKQIEAQAHRFAGAFLFPRDEFMTEVRAPSLDYFCSLKRRWGMSIAAMTFRAFNLGLIDDIERSALFKSMARRGWRGVLREPFDQPGEMPVERPRMLKRGVEAVVDGGVFGRSALLAALALPTMEIEQIAGLEVGYLTTADIVRLPISTKQGEVRAVDLESGKVVEFHPRGKR